MAYRPEGEEFMTAVAPQTPQQGVLSALVTPYGADGRPDAGGLAALIDFQVDGGVDGLFILGTSGEGLLLSPEERMAFTETVLDLVASRVPVVVHCGAADTATAVTLAHHAAGSGATALAALPPLFFPYTDESQQAHFARIAEAAPDVDHYIYDNPERVGYALGPALVMRLIRDIPNLRGLKDTGDSLARITTYLSQPDPPAVYTGNNVLFLGALVMGAAGAVSTFANVVPELFAAVVTAYREARIADARDLQLTIARLQTAVTGLPYIAAAKHLLQRRGLPGGMPRSPLPALTREQRMTLDARLDCSPSLLSWMQPLG
jgi:dihydrodipicolinate synthase/N-acetylneuraminate lyase